ncbi:hypothetical protein KY284_012846 [Solanum tuberosum]|nr:hypothetical protein KY284_012846 [Solanum tuberosum]
MKLRKLVKTDVCTSATLRGRYARICVEILLDTPVHKYVYIGHHKQNIVYEGSDIFCNKCGVLGHNNFNCNKKLVQNQLSSAKFKNNNPNQYSSEGQESDEQVKDVQRLKQKMKDIEDDWKTITFPRHSRKKRVNDQDNSKATGTSVILSDADRGKYHESLNVKNRKGIILSANPPQLSQIPKGFKYLAKHVNKSPSSAKEQTDKLIDNELHSSNSSDTHPIEPNESTSSISPPLPPIPDLPCDHRREHFLCHPSTSLEHDPTLMGGDRGAGPCPLLLSHSGRTRDSNSCREPNFHCKSGLVRNGASNGGLQHPLVDDLSTTEPFCSSYPTYSILPSTDMGNATTKSIGSAPETPPASSTIILTNDVEVPNAPHPSHVASSSQLLLRTRPPPTPEMIVPDIDTNPVTEEIEKALELMRETRTEIMILKDIKLNRHKGPLQSGTRKLHSNIEPNDKEWVSHKPTNTGADQPRPQ